MTSNSMDFPSEERKCLEALEAVVSKRYFIRDYHIGGYQEEAVCLEADNSGWTVYTGERGNHMGEVRCDTILQACSEFIRKLTHLDEDISSMESELLLQISSTNEEK